MCPALHRSWVDFFDRNLFGKPRSLADCKTRLEKNVIYFQTNYAAVALVFLALSMLTSPFLMVSVLCLAAVWYHASRTEDLEIGSLALRGKTKTYALAAGTAFILFMVAGSTLFNIVGSSCCVMVLHAAAHQGVAAAYDGDDLEMHGLAVPETPAQ